ncbi:hypothetical protein FPOA_09257 [Fusarium poae]|uniref:Uncharacterized protein n=1 Tax=Fusarium poae TaxID=36050 RepID=A0A1B8ARC9_FUSPO|nr:hypothetical protein FPOA_09257 [Fusarium poae]
MPRDITAIPNARNSQNWVYAAVGISIGLMLFAFAIYRAVKQRKQEGNRIKMTNEYASHRTLGSRRYPNSFPNSFPNAFHLVLSAVRAAGTTFVVMRAAAPTATTCVVLPAAMAAAAPAVVLLAANPSVPEP